MNLDRSTERKLIELLYIAAYVKFWSAKTWTQYTFLYSSSLHYYNADSSQIHFHLHFWFLAEGFGISSIAVHFKRCNTTAQKP